MFVELINRVKTAGHGLFIPLRTTGVWLESRLCPPHVSQTERPSAGGSGRGSAPSAMGASLQGRRQNRVPLPLPRSQDFRNAGLPPPSGCCALVVSPARADIPALWYSEGGWGGDTRPVLPRSPETGTSGFPAAGPFCESLFSLGWLLPLVSAKIHPKLQIPCSSCSWERRGNRPRLRSLGQHVLPVPGSSPPA